MRVNLEFNPQVVLSIPDTVIIELGWKENDELGGVLKDGNIIIKNISEDNRNLDAQRHRIIKRLAKVKNG